MDKQPREIGPADHLLERLPGGPPFHHRRKLGRGPGGSGQQRRLVLGKHAPSGAQPGNYRLIGLHE